MGNDAVKFEDIRLVEVIEKEVGQPRNDGSAGSGLYTVAFRLSGRAPTMWEQFFVAAWDQPSEYTSMHRPGIASVYGDKVTLDGTTLDEVARYHKKTLMLACETANKNYVAYLQAEARRNADEERRALEHRDDVRTKAAQIRFDEEPG